MQSCKLCCLFLPLLKSRKLAGRILIIRSAFVIALPQASHLNFASAVVQQNFFVKNINTNLGCVVSLYKKVPILLFLGLNISIFIVSGLPDRSEVGRRWMQLVYPYVGFFSLDQNWSMFAPNPSQVNSYVDAVITFTDGSSERWTFPRASQISGTDRFTSGERFRKYSQEGLLPVNEKQDVWLDLSLFIEKDVKKLESFGRKRSLAKLEYFRYWNQIPHPEKRFIRHGELSRDFASEMVYQYLPKGAARDNKNNS